MRQREDWMVNAVHQFADGDARGALSQYALHDKLTLAPTREAAAKTLVAEWAEQRTSDLRQTLILAGTRAETRAINVLAQEERREQGELSSRSITVGGQRFSEGDRVCFTKNNKALGVCNGDFGVLESIRGVISSPVTPLTVRLDRPDTKGDPVRVRFTPVSNPTLDLGYAVTTHKAQGATVDRTFVLAGGWMQDRELSYVQMSRHREACHIYSSVGDAGDDTGSLVRSMARSRMHGMVLDTMREPERESSR